MPINFTDAVSAYQKIARQDTLPGFAAPGEAKSSDFADMLRDATAGAVDSLRQGETQSLKAAAGTADLNEVVAAVGKAEMTLQTVVALRDRVLQAYQEILRMPV
jgi:flagellar hook-basal body complex protein FliE